MNVLLLHLDGKLPNLALMRLWAWYASLGYRVVLRRCENSDGDIDPSGVEPQLGDPKWDHVFGSLIFERSKALAERARVVYPQIVLGGTGWDFEGGMPIRKTELPIAAQEIAPDYGGYPGYAPSIGFAQRGCRQDCDFCVVPHKEGRVRSVATLEAIWRGGDHAKQLVLLDNDFFGNKNWPRIIDEAIRFDFAISVIQGINARILTDEQAAAIARVRWMADDFSRRRVYTAWDRDGDEVRFFRGLDYLKKHGIKPDAIMVYMLIGYQPGETHADRDRRRRLLREYGCRPYPMAYVRDGELGDELRAFQSWCIQRKDELVPWEDWWGRARGSVRRLGTRRVSLPLFPEGT